MAVVTPSACRRVRLSFAALDDEGERDDDGARDERRDRSLLVAPRPLGLGQPLHQMVPVGMLGQQFSKMRLRQLKKTLIVPQGIIRIETDCRQLVSHLVYVRLLFSPAIPTLYKREDKPQN